MFKVMLGLLKNDLNKNLTLGTKINDQNMFMNKTGYVQCWAELTEPAST